MKLEKNAKMYGTLFSSVFMLSACTFGGGYVIVPLMRKKFVEDLHSTKAKQTLFCPRSRAFYSCRVCSNASAIENERSVFYAWRQPHSQPVYQV